MDNMEFANRIIELRKQKGLSQKELGEILGVSNKAVSKWENGESMPKTSTMIKLAEILGIDGNELIGFEAIKGDEADSRQIEIDKLKTENKILTSKLNKIDKKRKTSVVIVSIICIISIIASAIIGVYFSVDNKANLNIHDAGKENTKIVYSDITFVVPNDLQMYKVKSYMKSNEYYSFYYEKYADYYNTKGEKIKAIINVDLYCNCILINVGNKKYYYINEEVNTDTIELNDVNSVMSVNKSIADTNYYQFDYFESESTHYYNDDEKEVIIDFYNNKGKPIDKKIIEQYLGNNPHSINIDIEDKIFDEDHDVVLGEFFTDNDDNVYFYDYVTANAYNVGKELSQIVNGK